MKNARQIFCIAKHKFSTARIDQLLKSRGVGSRTHIKELIGKHRVFDENGKKIMTVSQQVPSLAVIFVDDRPVPPIPLLALFHKPVSMLSTMGDPQGRPNLSDIFKDSASSSLEVQGQLKAMHPVGRLDSDTSGLLLFSSDGNLTNVLLQPESGVRRVYEAVVTGLADFSALHPVLRAGVQTTDGIFPAELLDCTHIHYDPSLADSFKTAKDFEVTLGMMLREADLSGPVLTRLRLAVCEGKHRMVRRVLHNAGHSVVQLKRVSYGAACLGDLAVGQLSLAPGATQLWALQLLAKKKSPTRIIGGTRKKL